MWLSVLLVGVSTSTCLTLRLRVRERGLDEIDTALRLILCLLFLVHIWAVIVRYGYSSYISFLSPYVNTLT